jgi:hypothetical protein
MKLFRSFVCMALLAVVSLDAQENKPLTSRPNLAMVATVTSSARNGQPISTLNDGAAPVSVSSARPRTAARNPRTNVWVQYEWPQPVSTKEVGVFFWDYNANIRLPEGYRLQYWNGNSFVAMPNSKGLEKNNNQLNNTSFDEIKTTRIRLELDSAEWGITSVLEWVVYKTDNSPNPPPLVNAGVDRDVMIGGKTYLSATVHSVGALSKVAWKKISGPGTVSFSDPSELNGSAGFSALGDYVLGVTAAEGPGNISAAQIKVKVHQPPSAKRLDVVYTKKYSIDNKLWNDRAKAMIVNWIPFCIDQNERTDLTTGQGGLDNFIEAAKALRGEPHAKHKGYVFSNAWVHQTVEAMCIALMVDAKGDKEIIAAHEKMRTTLERWIPMILAAQEPDGYLHTAFTLRDTTKWKERWSPRNRGDHEGYVAGYFIESAINHYTLTEGKDKRLYNAAKKLADCWVRNIGPGKKEWYDGHQEMEQALVRFGRFVNDMEGGGKGDNYIKLSKFLLDNRKNGSEYDQSHVPVQQQYEAVGHAVRATYN